MISNKFIFIAITGCILILNSFFILDLNNTSKYFQTSILTTNSSFILTYLKDHLVVQKNKKQFINAHDYDYVINPGYEICSGNQGENLILIAFVLSSRNHFKQRDLIRKTWSNRSLFPQMRVVFLIGSDLNHTKLDEQIQNESNLYGDIIQESFKDAYLNLTLKTVMGIKWVTNYCSKAKYALKVDDDVIVNPFSLLPYLKNLNDSKNSLQCYIHFNATIQRRITSKFYVSYDEIKEDHYVNYCDGPAYVFPSNLASQLYETSKNIKHFKFEDVFFGQLASKLKLNFTNLMQKYSKEPRDFLTIKQLRYNKFYFYPCKSENFLRIWTNLSE